MAGQPDDRDPKDGREERSSRPSPVSGRASEARSTRDRQDARAHGAQAEEAVAAWLVARGHAVVARNWRGGGGELDVVSVLGRRLYFVEVRAWSTDAVDPLEGVDGRKQWRLKKAGEAWLGGWTGPEVPVMCLALARIRGSADAVPLERRVVVGEVVWDVEFIEDAL